MVPRVDIVNIYELRPHEAVIESRVAELIKDFLERRVILKPILVDEATMTILDGHHRVEALKRLGKKRVPAILVNYFDDLLIAVASWRDGFHVSKGSVIYRSLRGVPYEPKTSRHILKIPVPVISMPLDLL